MEKTRPLLLALVCFGIGFGCQGLRSRNPEARAQLLEGLEGANFKLTTDHPLAQRYFDQGLMLTYGFNHDAAERSFMEAARLDPECAMCWWGASLVLGPHINSGMDPANNDPAWGRLIRAQKESIATTAREQAYIQALSLRYAPNPPADRSRLDQAYAAAMRELARAYPDDMDAQALFAESLMNLHPWNFYTKSGREQPWTAEIVAALEGILARSPDHAGANHFYIHAVEASQNPERALPSARRLDGLVPGAGHLVHMPAHIYMRTGRYHDASLANRRGIAADKDYLAVCQPQGLYPLGYVPHNHHFLWASATMEGDSATALAAARDTAARMSPELMRQPGFSAIQHYWATPLFAQVRFGRWDEILKAAAPPADLAYPTAIWHYARGMAQLRKGEYSQAQISLAALATIAADPAMKKQTIWDLNNFADVLTLAQNALAGELASAQGNYKRGIAALREARRIEDRLNYDEPPPWHYPVRQSLGAVYLAAGELRYAEENYREDLRRNPENGWSLYGLAQALRTAGKADEAALVEARFKMAWAHADVTLASSRF